MTRLDQQLESLEGFHAAGGDLPRFRLEVTAPTGVSTFEDTIVQGKAAFQAEIRIDAGIRPHFVYTSGAHVTVDLSTGAARGLLDTSRTGVDPIRMRLKTADGAVLHDGSLEEAVASDGVLRLQGSRGLPGVGLPLCREARALLPERRLANATWLPQVFGEDEYAAPPLFPSITARLAEPLAPDDAFAVLDRPVPWPEGGRLQVADEVIVYTATSSDGRILGTLAAPLGRPTARTHEAGSRVVLWPPVPLEWCLADHPIDLLSLTADGTPVTGGVSEERDLGGRVATLHGREALPLVARHALSPVVYTTMETRLAWAPQGDSSALNPGFAFFAVAGTCGAVLTASASRLSAVATLPAGDNPRRFDRITGLALCFDFTTPPGWTEQTRLRVRVTRDPVTIEQEYGAGAVIRRHPMEGVAAIPAKGSGDAPVETIRCGFDRVDGDGPWTYPVAAIDGHLQEAAQANTASPATLRFCLQRQGTSTDRYAGHLAFCVHVENLGATPAAAELAIKDTSGPIATTCVVLPPAFAGTAGLEASPVDPFAADVVYTLAFPEGGTVGVREAWLDVDLVPSGGQSARPAEDIPVTVDMPFAPVFHPVEMDLVPFVEAALGWNLFEDAEVPFKLEMELLDAPTDPLFDVIVRQVRIQFVAFPVTSVRPEPRLLVRARGRLTDSDGNANPARVAGVLARDRAFANVPAEAWDSGAEDDTASVAEALGLGVRAVIAGPEEVAGVLGRLLGETALGLVYTEGAWRLLGLALPPDPSLAWEVPPSEVAFADTVTVRPAWLLRGPGCIVREQDSVTVDGRVQAGEEVRVRWLAKGAAVLAEFLSAWRLPEASEREVLLDPRWARLAPGVVLRVHEPESGRDGIGIVGSVRWDPPGLRVRLLRYAPI